MTDIRYVAPRTLDEAIGAFAAAGSAARIMAGGTDLLVQMRNGVVTPGTIVDIKKIAELTTIEETAGGGFKIGAAVSGAALRDHAKLKKAWPTHLASVRDRVFDHVDPGTVTNAARALSEIAAQLETNR